MEHVSDVLVDQVVVVHIVSPIHALGVSKATPKFTPKRVIHPPRDAGLLVGLLYVTTGESYVKTTAPVPARVDEEYTIETPTVSPGGNMQATFDTLVQADVAHPVVEVVTRLTVPVRSYALKLVPSTMIQDARRDGMFHGALRETSGESYVKALRLVPTALLRVNVSV